MWGLDRPGVPRAVLRGTALSSGSGAVLRSAVLPSAVLIGDAMLRRTRLVNAVLRRADVRAAL